jgi:hypothetical protein
MSMRIGRSEFQKARQKAIRDKVYHLMPSNGAWAVKRVGTQRASRVFRTRDQVLEFLGVRASRNPRLKDVGEVVIHDRNGGVESRLRPIGDSAARPED